MDIFKRFVGRLLQDNSFLASEDSFSRVDPTIDPTIEEIVINPATGLQMIGGIGGLDVGGNPYGTDLSRRGIESLSDSNSILHSDDNSEPFCERSFGAGLSGCDPAGQCGFGDEW